MPLLMNPTWTSSWICILKTPGSPADPTQAHTGQLMLGGPPHGGNKQIVSSHVFFILLKYAVLYVFILYNMFFFVDCS